MSAPPTTLGHMGWFSDFKAKREAKAALQAQATSQALWQADIAALDKLIAVFTAVSKGEDAVANTLMQKSGERTIWSGPAVFHEAGRTPTRYAGGSTGVSIPIAGGIRFRVGAMQGQAIPGIELQMDKDQGIVMLTTKRVIFTGPLKSIQWDFDNILMISTTPDESDYFISVSNRQETSGIRFQTITGHEFNRFLGSAFAAHESGIEEVLKELERLKVSSIEQKPE
ncbi:MAG: hypothetical protein RJA33_456 [Actinomycetota bacterium]